MSQSTLSQLLSQLAAMSPMPSDATLLEGTAELVDQYDELIEEIGQHLTEERPGPTEEAQVVRVLADSFGPDSGLGTFWGPCISSSAVPRASPVPFSRTAPSMGSPGSRA